MPEGPRIGFAGVIDERLDVDLLTAVADSRPDYQFVMVGPVVKIDPAVLPRRDNVHYLGMRDYETLPEHHVGVGCGRDAVRAQCRDGFISPTKTPEYLAAGLPVVATGIRDVVRQYGDRGLVAIADDPAGFAAAIDGAMVQRDDPSRLRAVDAALASVSWDSIWRRMVALERAAAESIPVSGAGEIDSIAGAH